MHATIPYKFSALQNRRAVSVSVQLFTLCMFLQINISTYSHEQIRESAQSYGNKYQKHLLKAMKQQRSRQTTAAKSAHTHKKAQILFKYSYILCCFISMLMVIFPLENYEMP